MFFFFVCVVVLAVGCRKIVHCYLELLSIQVERLVPLPPLTTHLFGVHTLSLGPTEMCTTWRCLGAINTCSFKSVAV